MPQSLLYDELAGLADRRRRDPSPACTTDDVARVLAGSRPGPEDLPVLLSAAAAALLEPMAAAAAAVTRRHFGNAIFLFTPFYLSNYCENSCPYCSFACQHAIARRHLDIAEVETEAALIAATGIRHILLLTGEAPRLASVEYIADCVSACTRHFSAIGIEVYPLTQVEYARVIAAGVDSLTLYQEVYDETVYCRLHTRGPKSDYRFRLDAPERACRAGIRSLTIGSLVGLGDWREEALATAHHLRYLQHHFPGVELSVSFPRLRPMVTGFAAARMVSERELVQLIAAFRLIFPTVGITVSTRESAVVRSGLLPLGVTRMSAGVSTAVGGHGDSSQVGQFEISDGRSVDEVCRELSGQGFQPVMHDWSARLCRE